MKIASGACHAEMLECRQISRSQKVPITEIRQTLSDFQNAPILGGKNQTAGSRLQ
jgi:hypothetical protein